MSGVLPTNNFVPNERDIVMMMRVFITNAIGVLDRMAVARLHS